MSSLRRVTVRGDSVTPAPDRRRFERSDKNSKCPEVVQREFEWKYGSGRRFKFSSGCPRPVQGVRNPNSRMNFEPSQSEIHICQFEFKTGS